MTKLPAFLFTIIICICIQNTKAQSFTFGIALPGANQPSDSVLSMTVAFYTSTYELSKIIAVTEGRADTLDNAGSNGTFFTFHGSIQLSGLGLVQGNTYKLKITCQDVLGNEKSDSVNYIYAKDPKAAIIYPAAGANTWPSLRIKTSHTGFDTCTSVINVKVGSQTVFTYNSLYDDIDTTITLNASLNGNGTVELRVRDKWNRMSYVTKAIIADSYLNYLYVTPVYTGSGNVLDYNYGKILEARNDAVYIVDNGFQTASPIPGTYTTPAAGTLTPYGAVWGGKEWTNGVLYNQTYERVGGKYATYTAPWFEMEVGSGTDLYRRDLLTRSDVKIDRAYESTTIDSRNVDTNGTVVYFIDYSSNLVKYKNGSRSYVGYANTPYGIGLQCVKGDTILYSIVNYENYNTNYIMDNDSTSFQLSYISGSAFNGGYSMPCLAAGQYIAYPKLGATSQYQIWVRDSTGNSTQRTFFGTGSYLAGLNAAGDLMFMHDDKLHFLKKDSINSREIGGYIGTPFYKDSTWYIIRYNSLYKININAYRTIAAGNWSNPASWQYGTVPLANADVIVDTNIIVDANVTCNTLRVIPPGSITVLPGVNLTVLH